MAMYNLDLLSNNDVAEDWEEGKHGWKGRRTVNDEKGDMVDFEAVREIPHSRAPVVGVRYNDDFVSSINELGRELVDMTFDSARLGEEEIANHGDIVRHGDRLERPC